MEGRRTMIWGGAVAVLALISLGGAAAFNGGVVGMATGGSGGCNGAPQTVPDEVPDNVIVAEPIGAPASTPRPAAADLQDWLVEGKILIKVTSDAIDTIDDGPDGPTLSAEFLQQLDKIQAPADNPTFAFHDRNSALIEHFMERGSLVAEGVLAQGEILPRVESIVLVELPGGADPTVVIPELEALPWVEWVEQVSVLETATTANLSGYQWNVDTLQTTSAHEISTGDGVKVAVVDTGVQAYEDGFRDLRVDLCVDLVDHDLTCDDPNGHGTHMAGVIAQLSDNDIGVNGIAPDVTLIPVRVANQDGIAESFGVANGIVYAALEGAQVINVGVGGYIDSKVIREAVDFAERLGAVVVAPAGNDSYPEATMYPAGIPNVLGVGCVDMTATICGYSNHGPGVDVYAPGGTVEQDDDGDGLVDGILAEGVFNGKVGYVVREGTSVASAHVAGQTALLYGLGPDRSPQVIRELIVGTADPLADQVKAVPARMINPLLSLQNLRDVPGGDKPAGAECTTHIECSTGVCEGQGCGETAGTCASAERTCTLDLRPYCGCNDRTFLASSTCANQRYRAEGTCE